MQRIARRNKFKSCGGINAALWIFFCFSLSEGILLFFPRLNVFLCKSFKRYKGIIRTDCDYRKQSTPSGVGAPPLFNVEKTKTLLGRGDALKPRPTFEAKSRQKPPEGVPFPASQ